MEHPHPGVRSLKMLHHFAQRTPPMRVGQDVSMVPVLNVVLPDVSGHQLKSFNFSISRDVISWRKPSRSSSDQIVTIS